jgi:hypothetical protein
VTGFEAGGDREHRLTFAIPAVEQDLAGLDTSLLDPADADDRALLIRSAHPELDTDQETMVICGREIDPRLHLTLHEVVATQLAEDDPPEAWATAQRLRRLGYGRHEILHMLGAAVSTQIWEALHDRREYDADEHRAALAALPESWERQRPGGPAPPAVRDAHASEAKRRRKAERAARKRRRRR